MLHIDSDITPESEIKQILSRNATIKSLDDEIKRFVATKEGQMILSREETYRIDRIEQDRHIRKQAFEQGKEEGLREGKAESIESMLRIRFPEDFTERFQPWRSKLYEKPLPVLASLFPLSVSCKSLSEFTQNL